MHSNIRRTAALCIFLISLAACASTDYLPVRYQLPDPPDRLDGRQVALQVVDQSGQASIFGPTMRETFRHFTGNFALSVARGQEQGVVVGAFDLNGLFRQAMVQRLEQAGVRVVDPASEGVPRMTVVLTRFVLDHDRVKWTGQVDYRVELSRTEALKAAQNVSATEERFRLPGSKDIERVVSDIFTTIINRLDLVRLFADAKV
jgi:hypothetical protein